MQIKFNKSSLKSTWVITLLIASFIFVAIFLFSISNDGEVLGERIETISASSFQNEINSDDVIILDIRTPEEFASGRIANSQNIDFYAADFKNNLEKLDKDKEYKIYCNSGNRSESAKKIMEEMGFKNVVELRGGIQAWMSNGLPTCTTC